MAAPQNFRSAFNGFNRQDVVHYLEYINTKHQDQINSLTAETEDLHRQLEELQAQAAQIAELEARLAAMTEAIAKVDTATAEITAKTDEAMSQLTQLQMAVSTSKQALQDAASLMNTIRPNY